MLISRRSGLVLAAAFLLPLAAADKPWSPAVDEARQGGYQFQNLGGSPEHPVKLTVCADVACAGKKDSVSVTQDSYSMPAPAEIARPYWLVERGPGGKDGKQIIGARRIVLQGAYNFRDLGGMKTADGKSVRWGQVFRSDALAQLTADDYVRLNSLGISLVCDLRTREERTTAPTDWKGASPAYILAPVSEDAKGGSNNLALTDALRSGKITVEDGRKALEQFYVHVVLDSAPKLGMVLRAIETTDHPAMFHCQGGRDRTGITAALLLTMLGVPKQTIMDDFVVSMKYLGERPAAMPANATEADLALAKRAAEITELQPRYLEAIFAAISQKYGNFDAYRRQALRISDADVRELKVRLLQ
jgi:protein-tyrosine phosphatase